MSDSINGNVVEKSTIRPIISIGIPTYNRADFLIKCIENIYSEVGNDSRFEVLICDNDSTDNTSTMINELLQKYETLVYYKNDTNIGVSKTYKRY